jgi:ubiquinone/menaquinone biosynthesis C-methylase UbiE
MQTYQLVKGIPKIASNSTSGNFFLYLYGDTGSLPPMRIITTDDLIETYAKLVQRGSGFLGSKFRIRGISRTLSAFDNSAEIASSWWQVPAVRRRWNRMISGDEDSPYEDHVRRQYLKGSGDLRMLSLGSGSGSHEIRFARQGIFAGISCMDIARNLLDKARQLSIELGLRNMEFICADAHDYEFGTGRYDVILFHASLHHFKDIDRLIGIKLIPALKPDGIMVINEYVGPDRLQFPRRQIRTVNRALKTIPKEFRRRFRMRMLKKRVSGPGILRMLIADPSEARESSRIMGTLDKYLVRVELKPYGGNILMPVLKDIAHHFTSESPESGRILEELIRIEDEYLADSDSDFVFAVYRKKKS